jgi:hypothetical protein
MKIRMSFISNSSTTSFILGLRDVKPCGHCGRSDPDFVQFIQNANSDEIRVTDYNAENVLKSLKSELDRYQKAIDGIASLTDDAVVWRSGNRQITAVEDRKVYSQEIEFLRKRIEAVEIAASKGYRVVSLDIEQHNESAFRILESMKATGSVIEIAKDG